MTEVVLENVSSDNNRLCVDRLLNQIYIRLVRFITPRHA